MSGTENVNVLAKEKENGSGSESVTTAQVLAPITVKKSATGTKSIQNDQSEFMSVIEKELAEKRRKDTGKGGIARKKKRHDTNPLEAADVVMTVKRETLTDDINTKSPNEVKREKTPEPNLPQSQRVLKDRLLIR